MVYSPLTVTEPGEPESFAYPSLTQDLKLVWDGLDGDIIGPIHASAASVHLYDNNRSQFRKIASVEDVRIDCYVTESRFAMICEKYDKGGGWIGGGAALVLNAGSKILAANRRRGKALTGHLRYAWLRQILFQRKEGFLGIEALRLVYKSESANMFLQLTLDKSTDSAALAHELMERTVAYRKADTDPFEADEAEAFERLLGAGRVVQEKGTMGKYELPTSWPAGSAAQYAPPAPPSKITKKNPGFND
ncbi:MULTISPECIES: hypothetical protein [Arthrobacter]|uniref:Uncharacterized protein n=1 Tax=Arthrobacter terricola TaxID=2547396 RepID=A0A4V2ZSD7_9MICC|nr:MULTISPECIES: hypothetical protein [Arthrobacter]MBT8162569.1 hypothetical protein [Arthrobacter sp. GN70]TDF92874.1 hypothetical protein E1809_17090 [Arthrobacter terricola]